MALSRVPPAVEARGPGRVRVAGREYLYFGGCDYLGLATDTRVIEAARRGLERQGLSASASRTTSGEAREHLELEHELARAHGAPAALLTADGYLAASVALQGLAGGASRALLDEGAHASLFDAARAAGLETEPFPHLDLRALDGRLRGGAPAVVLTDSVFPSRGEAVDVDGLVELTRRHGATLVLDDCHATGVLGARGLGSSEHPGVPGPGVIVVSTLSKALGTFGGFVLGGTAEVARMRTRAQAYAGATPVPAALAAAASAALRLAFEDAQLRTRLRANVARLRAGLAQLGIPVPALEHPVHALPAALGGEPARLAERLAQANLWVPRVRYLGDAEHLRLVVTAAHRDEHVDALLDVLARA